MRASFQALRLPTNQGYELRSYHKDSPRPPMLRAREDYPKSSVRMLNVALMVP